MSRVEDTVLFEDAQLVFKNFTGKEGMYNREGERSFHVLLVPELAAQLESDGWGVKYLKKRPDDDPNTPPQAHLPVSVSYKIKPPRIILITSTNRNEIGEKEVETLDYVDMAKVDFIVNPYNWVMHEGTPNERRGVSAYLKTMFVWIREDYLEQKYANLLAPSGELSAPEVFEQ
jgi:hypothetical protein